MKKIGFVTPWYGDAIPGGAEADLRGLAKHIRERKADIEIITTCVREFASDWNKNYHAPGLTVEGGVPVRRFPVRKRNKKAFDIVNYKLMMGQRMFSDQDEKAFTEEMINSPALYRYLKEHQEEYSVFVFTPYMFGTTYFGLQQCPQKSVLIPCFHDEAYLYLKCFRTVLSKAAGMVFHAEPEKELAEHLFNLTQVKKRIIGGGMDVTIAGNPDRFREKYHIKDSFILYAGRKDAGKNVDKLLAYFANYYVSHPQRNDLKLVMLGGGSISVPSRIKECVLDLGFVPEQDKYDAYSAASFLCQPSGNESFSLVIMESWLCKRPVLVYEGCAVTKAFAIEAGGGLYFKNYDDFEAATEYLLTQEAAASQMGENGRSYVRDHFAWDRIVDQYLSFFRQIAEGD